MSGRREARIWIEVDDLVRYFDGSLTPTGISRVQEEIFGHLVADYGDRIRFFRAGRDASDLRLIDYRQLQALISGSRDRMGPAPAPARALRWLRRRISDVAWQRAGGTGSNAVPLKAGDVILSLGASWSHRHFPRILADLKARHGVRVALLVHDILPVTHPALVEQRGISGFAGWLHAMAGVVDLALTPSKATAQSLGWFLAESGYADRPILPIPFGAGFGTAVEPGPPPRGSSAPVLYVSTIEIRKNHMLLFRVWERLVTKHGREAVPALVFAGKSGWGIADLQRALQTSANLDGKIRIVSDLSDAALSRLYADALFTVFPSFCEGWGLPVSESLAHGRLCIASNATSIPEVGGDLALYHDPRDLDAASGLIERAIFDRAWLDVRSQQIRQTYPRPSWRATAQTLVATMDDALT